MQRRLSRICLIVLLTIPPCSAQITQIIDSSGDGTGNFFDKGSGIAVDASGNVYVAGGDSDNVFRIGPGGVITEIIDSSSGLEAPREVAVDAGGNVYVGGFTSDNVYRIATPGSCSTDGTPCTITEIIDSGGDGAASLNAPSGLTVDSSGNVYVSGFSDNVFRIANPTTCSTSGAPCMITEIVDGSGDGSSDLVYGYRMTFDASGNLYVIGRFSDNVFRVGQPHTCAAQGMSCTITEILDATGDGEASVDGPADLAFDSSGRLYVSANQSGNIFRITNPSTCSVGTCAVTEVLTSSDSPTGLGLDDGGNLYFIAEFDDEVRRVSNPATCSTSGSACSISVEIGPGSIDLPADLTVDGSAFYVSGSTSDNAFGVIAPLFADGFETGDTSLWN